MPALDALKRKLSRELDAPWAASSKERVADAHVTCGDNVVEAVADFAVPSTRGEPGGSGTDIGSRIGYERR